jgi:fumarate hydratase class I
LAFEATVSIAEIAAKGILPFCQDTGTATIFAKKGQQVWTGGNDEASLSKGVYKTYTEENLRYSQTIPLDMYKEINSGWADKNTGYYQLDGNARTFFEAGGVKEWCYKMDCIKNIRAK